ncbi:hypothetical protein [Entomobacter blattae]|uniref:Uncharacterized protein n=1 Tax=Entomobacter blattae TaxID=2762277 RepID=A0A7H1NRI9_9PROT|nr:hypothetical protein [Entomobacter blattae]QNT78399.1 hypothetical protein JGUZn3_11730 [Entomobacter blattae]
MRRADRQKILDYFMDNWDFRALSPEATLLWFDLAFYLHERDLTTLSAQLAKGNVLDDLFSRNRTSSCVRSVEELCRFSLIRREDDGSMVCCFLEDLQQVREARDQKRQKPIVDEGQQLLVSAQAHGDRRSLTSRENGRKGGRPPKQRSGNQPSLLLPIAGGNQPVHNLKNLIHLENRFLGFQKPDETQGFSQKIGYLGFPKEKEKEIYINSSFSSSPSKGEKPNFKPTQTNVSDDLIVFASHCMDRAGIPKNSSSVRNQLWQVQQWLNEGVTEQTILEAIGYLTAKMQKNGQTPDHLGAFCKTVETFQQQENAVAAVMPTIEQAKEEDLLAKETFRKDFLAWQKRYEFSHDFTELAKMPRLENYLSRKSA